MPLPSHLRVGGANGTEFRGPIILKPFSANVSWRQEIPDLAYRQSPWLVLDRLEDFEGEVPYLDFYIPMVRTDGNTDTVALSASANAVSKAQFTVPRSGVITSIGFYSESAITQSGGANTFTTFTANDYATGNSFLSTAAHANTFDTNAAAINGGSNLSANVEYALTLSPTAANLQVVEADMIEVVATSGSTSGQAANAPFIHVRISTLPVGWYPRVSRGAAVGSQGLVQAQINPNVANGEFIGTLSATNEAETVGLDWHDQLMLRRPDVSPNFNPWEPPVFEAFVNFPTALAANQIAVVGIGTAFNATFSSISKYAWFKLNASMAVTIEGTDGTNTTTGQAAVGGLTTLTAGTYYLFTIDWSDYSNVAFYVNQVFVGTINMNALVNTHLFQPVCYVQKASGTGTPGIKVDFVRCNWLRF